MRRFTSFILIFSIFGLIFWLPTSSFCQRRGAGQQIGTVDFRLLLLLHPTMAKYNPKLQSFKLSSGQTSAAQISKRRKEHQKRINDLEQQTRRLKGKIAEEYKIYERKMSRISDSYLSKMKDDLATAAAALETQTYNLNKRMLETKHKSYLRMLGDQLAGVNDELASLKKVSYKEGYSTPEESRKQFIAILNETRQYVQSIARKKGIEIVLNSSFKRSFALRDKSPSRKTLPPGQSYANILAAPFLEPTAPEDRQNMDRYVSGYYSGISDQVNSYVRYESTILAPFTDFFVDTDILMGGVDLTAEVLAAIFNRYKVNENIGNVIIKAVTTR
jgi:ribosomal protein L9